MFVYVCVCVRACMHACACVRACMCVSLCVCYRKRGGGSREGVGWVGECSGMHPNRDCTHMHLYVFQSPYVPLLARGTQRVAVYNETVHAQDKDLITTLTTTAQNNSFTSNTYLKLQ